MGGGEMLGGEGDVGGDVNGGSPSAMSENQKYCCARWRLHESPRVPRKTVWCR